MASIKDRMIGSHPHNGMSLRDRFELSYMPEPNSGCWLWIGTIGYPLGVPRPRIKHKTKILAGHRVSIELFKGPIPHGMYACHTCHNTYCVNPDHLYIGTAKQNSQDMVMAGRHAVNNPSAREAIVRNIEKANEKRRAMTTCKRGHPLAGTNVRIDRRGARVCRECTQISQKKYKSKKRSA